MESSNPFNTISSFKQAGIIISFENNILSIKTDIKRLLLKDYTPNENVNNVIEPKKQRGST